MAVTWTDFNNGDSLLNIRNSINTFNNNVVADITNNTNEIALRVKADGTTVMDKIQLAPQVTAPTHYESTLYYDDVEKSATLQTDIEGFNHNLGQEMVIRVVNRTGSTLLNGKVITGGGTDVTTQLPSVRYAQADTFQNAQILGMATHDIGNNEEGFITAFGFVRDFDTSGVNQGQPAYLSETVPGGLTNIQPDIISRVGGCLISDAVVGKFFVNPSSSLNLPNIFGVLQGQTTGNSTYSVTAIAQPLENYAVENNVVMSTDPLLGHIEIPQDGQYEATFTTQLSFSSSPTSRTLFFDINDGVGNIYTYPYNIGKDVTSSASSFTLPFIATVGQDIRMNIRSGTNMTITFNNISFSIKSLDIR